MLLLDLGLVETELVAALLYRVLPQSLGLVEKTAVVTAYLYRVLSTPSLGLVETL